MVLPLVGIPLPPCPTSNGTISHLPLDASSYLSPCGQKQKQHRSVSCSQVTSSPRLAIEASNATTECINVAAVIVDTNLGAYAFTSGVSPNDALD